MTQHTAKRALENTTHFDRLLDWYDQNGRALPWRHAAPDPYHVILSEFMLQQTTVKAVIPYYHRFLSLWPTIEDLANAEREAILREWAGLGYYNRAKNLHAMAIAVRDRGAFPSSVEQLKTLPGVGDYTAAAVAAFAFGAPVLPLDGNIKRILSRLNRIDAVIDRPSAAMRDAQRQWQRAARSSDVPQAFMDLANAVCRPKNPKCDMCPLFVDCDAAQFGVVNDYPKRLEKRPKKNWQTHIYVLMSNDGIAITHREEGQVLGGLEALPSSDWGEQSEFEPPVDGNWSDIGVVNHIFTHIALTARVWFLHIDGAVHSNQFTFRDDPANDLATLWRKALALCPIKD